MKRPHLKTQSTTNGYNQIHAKMFISFSIICYTQMCVKTGGGDRGICCCCFCSITTISGMFLKTAFISLCSTGDLFNSHPHLLSWLALRWLRCFQQRGSVCCWCRLSHAHLSRGFSADSEWGINKTIISASYGGRLLIKQKEERAVHSNIRKSSTPIYME